MDSYPSLQDIPIQTPVLLDGGIGTGLTKYGYNTDTPLVKFAVENPDAVIALQQGYLDSGAQIIRTNTFASNTFALCPPLSSVTSLSSPISCRPSPFAYSEIFVSIV